MEALTRLFLLRPPAREGAHPSSRARTPTELPIDGTLDFPVDEASLARSRSVIERLARRNPAAVFGSPSARSTRVLSALSECIAAPVEIEPQLRPRFLGSWQSALPSGLGSEWGTFLSDRRRGAPSDAEPLESTQARVLAILDRISATFSRQEVIVVLHADGIRAALAHALDSPGCNAFAPEPGQAIALDWAHPEAREFKHAIVGIGFDWDVAPASNKVHRFPGGASVLPRSS